jgi:glucokinase
MTNAPPLALAIEIGGTKLQVALGRSNSATLLHTVRRSVDVGQGAVGIRRHLVEMVTELLAETGHTLSDMVRTGIGFGGPLDSAKGVTLTSFQVSGWTAFPLRRWAEEKWRVPARVANDADTAGLAEAHHGSGQGCRRLFYLTVGSGVGGSWIVDGQIDRGQGLGAAEIGHLWLPDPEEGGPVELEQFCSGWAIGRRAQAAAAQSPTLMTSLAGGITNIDARIVYAAATQGDALAEQILSQSTETLGLALANIINLLHPERIILGGGVSLMGPLFWEPLRTQSARHAIPQFAAQTEVVPATLGEAVVLIGALCL